MKRFALTLASLALAAACHGAEKPKSKPSASPQRETTADSRQEAPRNREPRPVRLDKANVLPLALDDDFEFRKTKTFFVDPRVWKPSFNTSINFERQRSLFGAITQVDRRERYGEYFTFFWRAKRQTEITIRFEYRTQNLGSFVQAQELTYPYAKGTLKTDFKVVGDDYEEDGRITAWRALLIENGKIVALNQSFLWR